jgi:hypothetical protein
MKSNGVFMKFAFFVFFYFVDLQRQNLDSIFHSFSTHFSQFSIFYVYEKF